MPDALSPEGTRAVRMDRSQADVPSAGSARAASAFFAVAVVASGIVFIREARPSWFGYDDWDFLAARTAGDLHGLLVPHGDHWSTAPILTYRALWNLFGLEFTPYVVVAVALHLATAVLLRVVMRRAGVDPWIATAAATLFAFFGAGYETTTKLFALSFGGWPLVLGLCQLILADHEGPWRRRDWLGLLAGLGAVASSAVGVPMVLAVGVATWWRRGARIALGHTVPIALIYAAWYVGFAESAGGASPESVLRFVHTGVRGVLLDLGQSWPLAILLGVVLVAGLVLARSQWSADSSRASASMPIGLLVGLLAFLVLTGHGRAEPVPIFGDLARLSHYADVAAVMILPAVAYAATAIGRRYSPLMPVLAVLLLVGIPGNVSALHDGVEREGGAFARDLMLSLPRAPAARTAPPDLPPEPLLAAPVTIGWLVDALDSGRVPPPDRAPTELEAEQILLRLTLWQTDGMRVVEPCTRSVGPVVRHLEAWGNVSLSAHAEVDVAVLGNEGWSAPVRYGQPFTTRYVVRLGQSLTPTRPVSLQFTSANSAEFELCG